MGGTAVNFPTPLTIHQANFPDIEVNAHYDTKPFGPDAPYYAWHIGRWSGDAAWELSQIHHRLFLANPPVDVQYFAIHYGYNYFLLGRAWRRGGFTVHFGLGPIVTNPESSVRHRVEGGNSGGIFDAGYYFSGIGAELAAEKDFYFAKHAFVVLEAAFTGGRAWTVPVAGGHADVPNLALHAHLGIGWTF